MIHKSLTTMTIVIYLMPLECVLGSNKRVHMYFANIVWTETSLFNRTRNHLRHEKRISIDDLQLFDNINRGII